MTAAAIDVSSEELEQSRLLRDIMFGLQAQADEARRDLGTFFGFVMVDPEKPKRRMSLVAHQAAGVEFIAHHPRCVVRWPLDTGKSSIVRALILWLLGRDPTSRGMIVGKTQSIAKKDFRVVRDYISDPNLSTRVRMVFPKLRPSTRRGDKWTETEFAIQRPPAYADSSLQAVGLDTEVQGSKINFAVFDDLLSLENTSTKLQREKLAEQVDKELIGRLQPGLESRCILVNVAWDREDLTYVFEERGWPTLTMNVEGGIRLTNADDDFDTDLLRPARRGPKVMDGTWYRLVAHDPDPEETVPLFPERYPASELENLRETTLPHVYAAQRMCDPRLRTDARCDEAWVNACKRSGTGLPLPTSLDELEAEIGYRPPCFTGVDIGIGENEGNDRASIFTWALLRDERRRVLRVRSGRWPAPDLLDYVVEETRCWDSVAGVESNAGQLWLVQFARRLKKATSVRVQALYTGKANKHDVNFGVEGIFLELKEAMWVIPCSTMLVAPRDVELACAACVDYRPPPAHTHDELMAWWLSLQMARKMGFGKAGRGTRVGKPRALQEGGTF